VDEHNEKIAALIKYGGAIGGAATGTVLGLLSGGPIGAVVGGAVGAALQTVSGDVACRELSRREAARVGATLSYAIAFIQERLDRGDSVREDNFFRQGSTGCSPAEEIFEGALLKMKNEHEERKARFYGQLFTNISFDCSCSRSEANYLLHVMDSVTFLQLSLVSLYSDTSRFADLPADDYQNKKISLEVSNILAATFALCQNGIVTLREPGKDDGTVVLDPAEIQPAHMALRTLGKRLFELAGLVGIAESDELNRLAKVMRMADAEPAEVTVNGAFLRNR
jgi:hypothetical protein